MNSTETLQMCKIELLKLIVNLKSMQAISVEQYQFYQSGIIQSKSLSDLQKLSGLREYKALWDMFNTKKVKEGLIGNTELFEEEDIPQDNQNADIEQEIDDVFAVIDEIGTDEENTPKKKNKGEIEHTEQGWFVDDEQDVESEADTSPNSVEKGNEQKEVEQSNEQQSESVKEKRQKGKRSVQAHEIFLDGTERGEKTQKAYNLLIR